MAVTLLGSASPRSPFDYTQRVFPPATESDAASARASRFVPWVEAALILAIFALYAGWPAPEPNEAHYLSKARHHWDPAWIPDDFFLDTVDSHWSFYLISGWMFRWFSFPAVAWIGRLATWSLMAIAWQRLSWALLPRVGAPVISGLLWVALNENFHLAGEWVVGGFEAKGLAYALVLFALHALVKERWNLTWILIGAASALHVLVGGWTAVAVAIAWVATGSSERPHLKAMLPGLVAGAVLSLPGLLPALVLTTGADAMTVGEANRIYVFERLPHHLAFFSIRESFRLRFALLVLGWAFIARFLPTTTGGKLLRRVINASLIVLAAGIAISLLPNAWSAGLLRFYWFRLADALVPLGVSLGITTASYRLTSARPRLHLLPQVALFALGVLLMWQPLTARVTDATPRADKPGKVADYPDWRAACEWIAAHTPTDACFLTPRTAQTFKWYAGRSEVVTWKDLPQDATSIVEWRRRLEDVYGSGDKEDPWYDSLAEEGIIRLSQLGDRYGAQYVLTESELPLALPIAYRNAHYAVYRLTPEGSEP